jgi:hypothetical protein
MAPQRKTKSAFVAIHATSRKAPAVRGQHQERAERMIVTLTAKGTSFFFHAERAY